MTGNQVFYFSHDGNFGDASGLIFIEVNDWETEDFEMVDSTEPWDRKAFAEDIAEFIRLKRPRDYWNQDMTVAKKYKKQKTSPKFGK
jgi:hypothetical protein